ncbi:MAG: polysaccharide deacetylase family protein [Clostridia bacterium]|nr:polysaccharide deacetylase family protein [Clostridia bacterium]
MRSIFMRYPSGKAKAVTFSYDDGVPGDKRLAEIFDRYSLKGTFNFTSTPCFSSEEIEKYFLSKGHEIAVHGAFHRANGNTRPIEGIRDVLDCRIELEKRCGRIIRGMAYPDTGITRMGNFGSYETIKSYLTELDIVYSRTLAGDNDAFELPSDFHAWMPSAHHKNPQIMEYVDKFLALDLSENVYHAIRTPRLLYIWGHSFEFDRDGNWDLIESICEKLSKSDEIWAATNMEIYEYVQAYKNLSHSADGHLVYNPSLTDVWMDVDGRVYMIPSGETVRID